MLEFNDVRAYREEILTLKEISICLNCILVQAALHGVDNLLMISGLHLISGSSSNESRNLV